PTTPSNCGTINNTAKITATYDLDSTNNSSSASITVNCNADVKVVKTADNATINAGDTAKFTVTVTSLGPAMAGNVTLSDPLPAGITWSQDNAACAINSGTLSCNFGNLVSG